MSTGNRSSPRLSMSVNRSKSTPGRSKSLLKSTLTKSMIYNETPNTSAENTVVGIQKAKNQFMAFEVRIEIYTGTSRAQGQWGQLNPLNF